MPRTVSYRYHSAARVLGGVPKRWKSIFLTKTSFKDHAVAWRIPVNQIGCVPTPKLHLPSANNSLSTETGKPDPVFGM